MEDLHNIWKHRWLNPKIKMGKSKIHGIGALAVEPIMKDEVIIILGGIIVPSSDIKEYRKRIGKDVGINIDENFWICPASIDEIPQNGTFNHSCEPNIKQSGSQIKFVAMINIQKGEEIVADYTSIPIYDFAPFKCNCQSETCKGFIEPK